MMDQATSSRAGPSSSSEDPLLTADADPVFSQPDWKIKYKGLLKLFNFVRDGRYKDVECLNCLKKSKKASSFRMVDHIRLCYYNKEARDQVLAEYTANLKNQVATKSAKYAKLSESEVHKALDELVLTFFGQNALPFSIVGSASFRQLLRALKPEYRAPTSYYLSQNLAPARILEYAEKLRKEINESENFFVTLEFDAWTSYSGLSILAVVITRPSGKSTLLDLIDISASQHTGEFLASTAITSVESSNIERKKINAIISDEASNFKLARALIVQEDDYSHIIQYRCMAHVLNLVGASISKSFAVRDHLERVVELIGIISRNKPLASAIKEAGGRQVIRPVPTRWYSTCAAINSVIRIRPVMLQLERRSIFATDRWIPILEDSTLWDKLAHLKDYFDRLAQAIGSSECRDCSLGQSTRSFLEFGSFIFRELPRSKSFIDIVKESYVKHFFKIDIDLLLAAYILDPNNRVKWMTESAIDRALKKILEILIQSRESDSEDDVDSSLANAFDSEYRRFISKAKRITTQVDTREFWCKNRDFLMLKQAGIRLSHCSSSSANTERIFSALSRICVPSRNRLSIVSMFNLLSILVSERSDDSSQRVRRNVAACSELSEEDSISDELGGNASEAPILDDALLPIASDVDEDFVAFEDTALYQEFKSLIDYEPEFVADEPSIPGERVPRLSHSERAQRIADKIASQRFDRQRLG